MSVWKLENEPSSTNDAVKTLLNSLAGMVHWLGEILTLQSLIDVLSDQHRQFLVNSPQYSNARDLIALHAAGLSIAINNWDEKLAQFICGCETKEHAGPCPCRTNFEAERQGQISAQQEAYKNFNAMMDSLKGKFNEYCNKAKGEMHQLADEEFQLDVARLTWRNIQSDSDMRTDIKKIGP